MTQTETTTATADAVDEGPKEIPAIRDESGKLKALKSKDFPRSREGRQAFCLYRAEQYKAAAADWEKRAEEIQRADDPTFQKQRKLERLKEQLAKLEAELAG